MSHFRPARLASLVLAAAVGSATASLAAPTPSGDWRFEETLESSLAGAPDLQQLGPEPGAFGQDVVLTEASDVFAFPQGGGLLLTPADEVVQKGTYTIEILMRSDEETGYRRVIDFKNGGSDCGLYFLNGQLRFYCSTGTGDDFIPAGAWVRVVVTRSGEGIFRAFLDGDRQFTFDDSDTKYGEIQGNVLRFFRDNECSGGACGEDGPGAVARIRTWGNDIGANAVAGLETCGDANGNGSVTAADALYALAAAVSGDRCSLARCDLNDSGTVTAADALLILRGSVNPSKLPDACVTY